MSQTHNTHGLVCDFGKHRGELYTRLPVSYLKWMVQCGHSREKFAQAELDRRGTVTPEVEVSGHAIDRASQRCLKAWQETAREDEGLHAWLCRMALEAREQGKQKTEDRFLHAGFIFVFEAGKWPVLKTVLRGKHADR